MYDPLRIKWKAKFWWYDHSDHFQMAIFTVVAILSVLGLAKMLARALYG